MLHVHNRAPRRAPGPQQLGRPRLRLRIVAAAPLGIVDRLLEIDEHQSRVPGELVCHSEARPVSSAGLLGRGGTARGGQRLVEVRQDVVDVLDADRQAHVADRKRVVSGKSVSVSLALGGVRYLKKKKTK